MHVNKHTQYRNNPRHGKPIYPLVTLLWLLKLTTQTLNNIDFDDISITRAAVDPIPPPI